MLKNLIDKAKSYYFRTTYRQRFIFFSSLFLILTPLPDIWLLKIQNYFISRKQTQLEGLKYEKVLSDLLYDVSLHQHLAVYKSSDKAIINRTVSQIENSILQEFKKINEINEKLPSLVTRSLGEGFSDLSIKPLDLTQIKEMWRNILRSSHHRDQKLYMDMYDDLVDTIRLKLSDLGYDYGLMLNRFEIENLISAVNLIKIPLLYDKLIDVYDLKLKVLEDPSADHNVNYHVVFDILNETVDETKTLMTLIAEKVENQNLLTPAELTDLREKFLYSQKALDGFIKDMNTRFTLNQIVNDSLTKALDSLAEVVKVYINLNEKIYETQLQNKYFEKYSTLFLIYLGSINITLYVILKAMTKHMRALEQHIQEMSKGKFSRTFCSDQSDEFGPIGISFDKMGESVKSVVGQLTRLGKQLTDSINQIKTTAKEQEKVVGAQETSIREIEKTAQKIAIQSRDLANMMDDISNSSREFSLADSAKSSLDHMQNQMIDLSFASTKIVSGVNAIHDTINRTTTLISFMTKVSDQARLLSLNSAIETANVHHQRQSFAKITQEIQRFAEKTSLSTEEIQNIINEISFNVATVRVEANICVSEIKEGVERLTTVNQQLSSITNQGKDQVRKFESVNDVMQVQAFAAENIIESISKISATAVENTKSIRSLHQTTAELGSTADELQRVTYLFFTDTSNEVKT